MRWQRSEKASCANAEIAGPEDLGCLRSDAQPRTTLTDLFPEILLALARLLRELFQDALVKLSPCHYPSASPRRLRSLRCRVSSVTRAMSQRATFRIVCPGTRANASWTIRRSLRASTTGSVRRFAIHVSPFYFFLRRPGPLFRMPTRA